MQMVNQAYYQMSSILLSLINHESSAFWKVWEWKLDPYRCWRIEKRVDVLISLRNHEKIGSPLQLISEKTAGFFCHKVFSTADESTLWEYSRKKNSKIVLQYRVSDSWDRIDLLCDKSQTAGNLAFEYLGQIVPQCLLLHNILTFHGVLMEYQGQGIIISAPSGTGKTTHARMWRDRYHSLIINGDRATVQRQDGIWTGFGLPWSGTSGEQINRSVPLKALVVLERGEKNDAHQITGLEAFGAVWPHLLYPGWDREMTGRAMDQLDIFLREIPIIRFSCRPDPESVDVLYHEIFR